MGTKTKIFTSSMTGAPVLNGVAGSVAAIFDACLVDGFGAGNAAALSVAANVATMAFAGTHPYRVGSVVLVAGATPVELNGEKRVTLMGANSIQFAAPGIADGNATGSITHKVAPAGWAKTFTGVNKRVYKPTAPEATGCLLRLVDTSAQECRAAGFESMSDVDTGQGRFPTAVQFSGDGVYWAKSQTADATAKEWTLIADDRFFYWLPKHHSSYGHAGYFFGDILSARTADPYGCIIRGNFAGSRFGGVPSTSGDDLYYNDRARQHDGCYMARAVTSIGSAQQHFHALSIGITVADYIGSNGSIWPYPNVADNGLILGPLVVHNASGLRGTLPGVMGSPQAVAAAFNIGDEVAGTGPLAGKRFYVGKSGQPGLSNASALFFDVQDDWR